MTRQLIAEEDPRSANAYYDQSMKRGFGSELRTRWSERAMKAAIGIEDLEEETMLVVLAQEETLTRLRQIRDEAIQKRLLRDPELARDNRSSACGVLDESGKTMDSQLDWTGHGMESHQALNEHVQSSLRSLLTPEQFELIPGRGGRKDQAKTEWDKVTKGKTARSKRRQGPEKQLGQIDQPTGPMDDYSSSFGTTAPRRLSAAYVIKEPIVQIIGEELQRIAVETNHAVVMASSNGVVE